MKLALLIMVLSAVLGGLLGYYDAVRESTSYQQIIKL